MVSTICLATVLFSRVTPYLACAAKNRQGRGAPWAVRRRGRPVSWARAAPDGPKRQLPISHGLLLRRLRHLLHLASLELLLALAAALSRRRLSSELSDRVAAGGGALLECSGKEACVIHLLELLAHVSHRGEVVPDDAMLLREARS